METFKFQMKIYNQYELMLIDIESLQDALTLIPNYSETAYQALQTAVDEIDEVLYRMNTGERYEATKEETKKSKNRADTSANRQDERPSGHAGY